MFDLALTGFLALFLALGIRRPFLWVLAYLYVDIVSPQKISMGLLTSIPVSLIAFCLAVFGWFFLDKKEGTRVNFRQGLILALLAYCGLTTTTADFPEFAVLKWAWVWKALVFAMFLPLTLRTRLRIEGAALTMVLSIAAIIIGGSIKTLVTGGGYGSLSLLVNDNTGLFEGSTISCVAVAIIPLILWLSRHSTLFPTDSRVRLFCYALVFACLMIPIGTQARTGLICAGLLAILMLRSVKNKAVYLLGLPVVLLLAVPLLPSAFTNRMDTIQNHDSDESASTRVAVWQWTLGYAADHPLGGGFDSYRGNKIKIATSRADKNQEGNVTSVVVNETEDAARAFHSAYFEMLGEQGWPGLFMWLALQITGITQLEWVIRRLRREKDAGSQSDYDLAKALQQAHFVYLAGALFVGLAYQPFIYMLIGLQIGLVEQVRRRQRPTRSLAKGLVQPAAPLPAA
ncbi:MAG: O-antigen ligase family protein [Sphingomonadales bacterium]|nr:O-antigen ligase family protein [Sphingomonadales bacterium]